MSTIVFILLLPFVSSAGPQIKTYKKGELQAYLGTDFLAANETFNEAGSGQSLYSGGDYLYLLEVPFGTRYSFTDWWAAGLELQFGYAESKTSDPVYKATRTNSTLNQVRVTTDLLLFENPIEVIPELEAIFPLEKLDNSSDIVPTSEGVTQTTLGVRAQQKFGSFVTFGRVGFTYRGSGRSNLLPYSIAGAFDTGTKMFGVELSGFTSISNDVDKDNPALRNGMIARTSAGVRRFYGVNPVALDATAFANMGMSEKWSFDLNAGYILSGTNYAKGFHIGAMVTMNFNIAKKPAVNYDTIFAPPPVRPQPQDSSMSTDRELEKFQEEVQDGVDQQMFKPKPTPKPPQKIQRKIVKKGPSQKRSSQKSSTTEDELKKELDNTEMKIQLRKNR